MKRFVFRLFSFKIIVVIFTIMTINQEKALSGTTYGKELSSTIAYGTFFHGGLDVLGLDMPMGFTLEYGTDPVGVMKNCTWAFATCDNSQSGFSLFPGCN
ncbi:hypothetical protein A3SI_11689 [Nitritalea halalkaliphila LW7]|uniref:Uncharacterized protein n=1 Tax=Nitritalea halalkaliphila LW7 TaxID=1189621 RepID=I5C2G9_9BACT|nr:hypothetical protein [Nitritalea halalkaliphila]EIM76021.1 hypothetical protein A3SI_11689 [Nitritalea halalkaliphila LW7]